LSDGDVRRAHSAHLPMQGILENLDFVLNPKLPATWIRNVARLEFIAAGKLLVVSACQRALACSSFASGRLAVPVSRPGRPGARLTVLLC